MGLATVFDLIFAAGIILAAVALLGAVARKLSRSALIAIAAVELSAAAAAWIAFALRRSHPRELAIAAAGLTACSLVAWSALLLQRALGRADEIDEHLAEAQTELRDLIEREARERAAELERTLARARADSVSLLVDEERRLAEDHRREFADREREVAASLTAALSATQAQVGQRLAGWSQDLDRVSGATKGHIAELGQRQKQLVSDMQLRLAADADRLGAETEELRAAVQRTRHELETSLEDVLESARAEVEGHAAERRRALHELDERMRRREHELLERIEREEGEVGHRIRSGFDDVERRQVEQLERVVQRAATTYSDEATQQFAAAIKAGREDAARRLSRELDRAVEVFSREAESVLAERLAHVGNAGAQRLERRIAEATVALEQEREARLVALDSRLAEYEAETRRRVDELAADAEAERAVLEARIQELLRKVESANSLYRT